MSLKAAIWVACALAGAATGANAQTSVDRSFKALANNCQDIQWSERALELYPTIASACQSVEQRNGKAYVKFQGTVRRVADDGRQLTVDFKDGGTITLSPPDETKLYIEGQATAVKRLRPGDQLNFYIAEDRLAAQFPETDTVTTRYVVVPIVAPQPTEQMAATLPETASSLPLLAFGGCLMLGFGASLTLYRRRRVALTLR